MRWLLLNVCLAVLFCFAALRRRCAGRRNQKTAGHRIFLPALQGRASTRQSAPLYAAGCSGAKKGQRMRRIATRMERALRRWAVPPGRRGRILNRENAVVTSKCLLCGFAAALRSPQETSRSQEMPGCSKQPNRRMGEITVFRIFLPALAGRASTRRVRPCTQRVAAASRSGLKKGRTHAAHCYAQDAPCGAGPSLRDGVEGF